MFVFVLFEKNTENEVCVRECHFHWWARDREVAREPAPGCRALLPCPMAHARRHARAASCTRATAAQTAKSFPALPLARLRAHARCGVRDGEARSLSRRARARRSGRRHTRRVGGRGGRKAGDHQHHHTTRVRACVRTCVREVAPTCAMYPASLVLVRLA